MSGPPSKASRHVVLAVILAALVTACAGSDSESQNPAIEAPSTTAHDVSTVTCSPSGTSLVLSAENTAYDKDCLAAPANQPFTIAFANRQKDANHNVVIVRTQEGEVLFRGGDPFMGVQTMIYDAPPLPAGEYRFRCEVHPNAMQGKFVVR